MWTRYAHKHIPVRSISKEFSINAEFSKLVIENEKILNLKKSGYPPNPLQLWQTSTLNRQFSKKKIDPVSWKQLATLEKVSFCSQNMDYSLFLQDLMEDFPSENKFRSQKEQTTRHWSTLTLFTADKSRIPTLTVSTQGHLNMRAGLSSSRP